MADNSPAKHANEQSEAAWGYFVNFWKYFFAMCVGIVILLAIVGT